MRFLRYLPLLTFLLCFGAVLAPLYLIGVKPEQDLKNSFRVYSNASFVGEERGRHGGNSSLKNLYYWSPSPIDEVQTYYESTFPQFIAGDIRNAWLITAFGQNVTRPSSSIPKSGFLNQQSFCERQKPYECATIILVNSEKQDINQLEFITPYMLAQPSELPELKDLPRKGTVIVYSYFVQSF